MTGDLRSRLERMLRTGDPGGSTGSGLKPQLRSGGFLFPGEEQEQKTEAGHVYLRELSIPLDQKHGNEQLEEALRGSAGRLALLDKTLDWERFHAASALFLDIETTGLAGGTGTWAFLIGLGWVENRHFALRQYFMRHPGEEQAMLTHFTAEAARFDTLVTFNGRSFDLPLIQTRQVLAGLPGRTEPSLHLDLLHCSRKLWKERLPSCSLRSLEEELLGLRRHGDIPGEEIPAVYFNYLRRGEISRLKQVFQHNLLDLLSMVALLGRITKTVAGKPLDHPADCYSLGKLYLHAGETVEAIRNFEQAATCGDDRLEQAAIRQLAAAHKKQGRFKEATALWKILIQRRCHDLSPYIELAKYHEHQVGELEIALQAAGLALIRARLRRGPDTGEQSVAALQHRLARLQRKLNKSLKHRTGSIQ